MTTTEILNELIKDIPDGLSEYDTVREIATKAVERLNDTVLEIATKAVERLSKNPPTDLPELVNEVQEHLAEITDMLTELACAADFIADVSAIADR